MWGFKSKIADLFLEELTKNPVKYEIIKQLVSQALKSEWNKIHRHKREAERMEIRVLNDRKKLEKCFDTELRTKTEIFNKRDELEIELEEFRRKEGGNKEFYSKKIVETQNKLEIIKWLIKQ